LLRIRASALPYGRYFTQSGGTNTPNTELAAETSINIAGINTIYVWFEDTTVTPTCTKKSFLLSQLFLFLHYQNIQTSLAALLTRYQNSNGGVYYSNPIKVCQ
jgi:hypothetical protein